MKQKVAFSKTDEHEIRHMMRMGFILPALFFLITTLLYIMIIVFNNIRNSHPEIIIPVLLLAAYLLSLRMNRKYRKDLLDGYKTVQRVVIEETEQKKSYEAGSGMTFAGNKMKESTVYYFIIERTRYEVSRDLFESCQAGESIYMFFTPHSNIHIGFGLIG